MGVLWFRWFFWRWNWEVTAKSEKTAPGSQSLTKKLTDRSWPQSEKNGSKNEEIKGGELEHPTKWGFKGKIKTKWRIFETIFTKGYPKGSIVLFDSSESKYGIWCCQGDPQPCGLENGDIDLRFPWIFHFLVHRWGHKRRAGDFVWNSSEKDDLKIQTSFYVSWNILKHLGRSLFTTCFFTFVLLS